MKDQEESTSESGVNNTDKKVTLILIYMIPVAAISSALIGFLGFAVVYGICEVIGIAISGGTQLEGIGAFIGDGGPFFGILAWTVLAGVVTGNLFYRSLSKRKASPPPSIELILGVTIGVETAIFALACWGGMSLIRARSAPRPQGLALGVLTILAIILLGFRWFIGTGLASSLMAFLLKEEKAKALSKVKSFGEMPSFNTFTADFKCRVCNRSYGQVSIDVLRFVSSTKLVGCYCPSCSGMICKECQLQEIDDYLKREGITQCKFRGSTLPVEESMWVLESCCLRCARSMKEVGTS